MMESDMTCKGFQYELGKEYILEGELEICKGGFHFCQNPFDCLEYYDKAGYELYGTDPLNYDPINSLHSYGNCGKMRQ